MANPPLIIRPAELSDLEALQAVIQRAYRGRSASASWSHEGELPEGERVSRGDLEALIGAPDARLSLAEVAGHIVGSSLVVAVAPGQCEIRLASVDPSFQGEGLGGNFSATPKGWRSKPSPQAMRSSKCSSTSRA